jgi:ERCC4-type nuclease
MARDVYNFLNSMSIICGIQVVRTSNKHETAHWLDATYRWWSKEWSRHKSHDQFQKPADHAQLSKPSLATRMWLQFDGIGWDKARALGNQFPHPSDIMTASEKGLMRVAGIGKGLARSIIKQRNMEVER